MSGGTDNHLMLVDTFSKGVTGKAAEVALGKAGITVNKNAIPFDKNPPMVASGVRVGTPAATTRGMREPEMDLVADLIARALAATEDDRALAAIKGDVGRLCEKFPLVLKETMQKTMASSLHRHRRGRLRRWRDARRRAARIRAA